MAVSLLELGRNNQKRENSAGVGSIATVVGGVTLDSGEEYQVLKIPAKSILKSLDMVVESAFGAGVTFDVGLNGDTTYKNDLNGNTVALTAASGGIDTYSATDRIVTVVPTNIETAVATGSLKIVAQYIETTTGTGKYTS